MAKTTTKAKAPRKPKNPNWVKWKNSDPRCILIEDLVSGILSLDNKEVSAEEAWELMYKHMAEFVDVPFDQFKARLKDHRSQVKKDLGRAQYEEDCLIHDRRLFPRKLTNRRGELVFDVHPAKELLRHDINAEKQLQNTPKLLWKSRPEYQEFDMNIFRNRIYQEKRRRRFLNYLQHKREEKKELLRCKPPVYEYESEESE